MKPKKKRKRAVREKRARAVDGVSSAQKVMAAFLRKADPAAVTA